MPAYVVVEVEVRDPVAYERYKHLAPPSIAAHGGKYIVRGAPAEALEGDWRPPRLVILEFPTAEQARSWWSSSDYAMPKALRHSCASTDMVLVEGVSTI